MPLGWFLHVRMRKWEGLNQQVKKPDNGSMKMLGFGDLQRGKAVRRREG